MVYWCGLCIEQLLILENCVLIEMLVWLRLVSICLMLMGLCCLLVLIWMVVLQFFLVVQVNLVCIVLFILRLKGRESMVVLVFFVIVVVVFVDLLLIMMMLQCDDVVWIFCMVVLMLCFLFYVGMRMRMWFVCVLLVMLGFLSLVQIVCGYFVQFGIVLVVYQVYYFGICEFVEVGEGV